MKSYNISKSLTVYQGRVGGVRTTLGSFRENKHLKLYGHNCVNLGQNVPQALPQNPPLIHVIFMLKFPLPSDSFPKI